MQADTAHLFAKTGQFLVSYGLCGFGCDVAWCRPRAAGGKNHIAMLFICHMDKHAFDFVLIVRNKGFHITDRIEDGVVKLAFECGNTFIGIHAAAGAVTGGN